jgi:hypothetical protein
MMPADNQIVSDGREPSPAFRRALGRRAKFEKLTDGCAVIADLSVRRSQQRGSVCQLGRERPRRTISRLAN